MLLSHQCCVRRLSFIAFILLGLSIQQIHASEQIEFRVEAGKYEPLHANPHSHRTQG